jgi:hypothetical protein
MKTVTVLRLPEVMVSRTGPRTGKPENMFLPD